MGVRMSSWRKSSPSTSRTSHQASGVRRGSGDAPAAPRRSGRRSCKGAVQWRDRLRARAVFIVDLDGEKVLGPRFIRLLEEIGREGSVRQAALRLGLGYRHAIAWIRRAESVLDRSLVMRQAGGVAGGGSGLTHDAVLLIHSYHRVSRALGKVVERAERDILEGR